MKRKKLTTIVLVIAFITGLSLLLYPKFSNYWNSLHQTKEIKQYVDNVAEIDLEKYAAILESAREYNHRLSERDNVYRLTEELSRSYYEQLNVGGSGVMGYIDIPAIGVSLPIYHGTSKAVLQSSVGHVEWTSLPVGGEGTHSVLSGHRGLPSSKLFTDLDKLVEGDVFILKILNETLTYEVDKILIVDPDDTSWLVPGIGKDYCTLVTCTPLGINTHRILVRGHRIENEKIEGIAHITADAVQIEPLIVAPVLFTVLMTLTLVISALIPRSKVRRNEKDYDYKD